MNIYPLKLTPIPKEIIWGGNKLRTKYNKRAPFEMIAESWELTVRPDGMSVIGNGEYTDMTLAYYLQRFPSSSGTDATNDRFPLLIKFIDACDDLSIQVHPGDEDTLDTTEDSKTEMWYIIDAEKDAEIVYGLKEDISEEEFRNSVAQGNTNQVLSRITVKKGDVYFIPSGQVHAICRGVFIAEIQQNSNTTYRLYDYDRTDKEGKKRELHVSKALHSIRKYSADGIRGLQFSGRDGRRCAPESSKVICDCKYFRVSEIYISGETTVSVDEKSFSALLFISAENASVTCGDHTVIAAPGDCFFIPAGSGDVKLTGEALCLMSEI